MIKPDNHQVGDVNRNHDGTNSHQGCEEEEDKTQDGVRIVVASCGCKCWACMIFHSISLRPDSKMSVL